MVPILQEVTNLYEDWYQHIILEKVKEAFVMVEPEEEFLGKKKVYLYKENASYSIDFVH